MARSSTTVALALVATLALSASAAAADDAKVPPTLQRAERLILEGKHEQALGLLRAFSKSHPKEARAHREIGFVLLLMGRPGDALIPLRRACALATKDVEAHLTLARAFERLKRFDEAIKVYEHAVTIGPRITSGWRSLARLLIARNKGDDRKRASEALDRAAKHNPKDEQVALDRAGLLLESKDKADHERARKVLIAYLIKVPHSARAARFLAQLEAAQGRFERAILQVVALLKRRDLPPPLREELEAEVALYRWLQSGRKTLAPPTMDAATPTLDLDQARGRLMTLLAALPEDGLLQLALARVELRAKAYGVARTWLERAALSGPKAVTADALLLQGVATELLRSQLVLSAAPPRRFGGESMSLPKARRLVELAPWLIGAHRTLGLVLAREGKFADAAKAYAAALSWATDDATRAELKAAQAAAEKTAAQKARNKNM